MPKKAAAAGPRLELLEGLRIDPDTLEVKMRMHGPEKHSGTEPPPRWRGSIEQRSWRLSATLLEAFSLLCQAGELVRFVSYIGEGRHQGSESAKVVEVLREAAGATSCRPEMCGGEQRQERERAEEMSVLLACGEGIIKDMAAANGVCRVVREDCS